MTTRTTDFGVQPIHGNLKADPVSRTVKGEQVAEFSVAHKPKSERDPATGKWHTPKEQWVDVTAWGDLADHVLKSLHKGDRVLVLGNLHREEYERNDGTPGVNFKIPSAYEVGPSLRKTTVTVHARTITQQSGPADGPSMSVSF